MVNKSQLLNEATNIVTNVLKDYPLILELSKEHNTDIALDMSPEIYNYLITIDEFEMDENLLASFIPDTKQQKHFLNLIAKRNNSTLSNEESWDLMSIYDTTLWMLSDTLSKEICQTLNL